MKNLSPFLFVLLGFLFMNCSSPNAVRVGNWELLGTRTVNYGLDKDEISVTARDGKFNKLKLRFRQAPLNMRKLVVHFGNGDKQNVSIQKNFKKGQETRVIDLKGGNRVIKKVTMWYDTKNKARKRCKVEVWGRH
jgi:hypothetical protein